MIRPVLKAGTLAYYDSVLGLIKCKVLSVSGKGGAPSSDQHITIKITALDHQVFKHGEVMDGMWGMRVVPRAAVRHRHLGAGIGYYTVESDK